MTNIVNRGKRVKCTWSTFEVVYTITSDFQYDHTPIMVSVLYWKKKPNAVPSLLKGIHHDDEKSVYPNLDLQHLQKWYKTLKTVMCTVCLLD